MVQTPVCLTPIARADAVWNGKASPNGWYAARCTGHNDQHASLSYREADDGGIILNCHAGCEREVIITGAGIAEKDLHPKGTYRPTYRPSSKKYDLVSLAYNKLLPWQFLFNEGVTDGYKWHGSDVVQITYYDHTGDIYSKVRVRTGPSGTNDSFWDEDTPGLLIPYGLQKREMAHAAGYVLIGEGESDAWTCWYHDIPYIGVPGAAAEKCLDGSLLNMIPALYVIQEPDAAGQQFYKRVHHQLRATGYTGKMFALPWQKLTGWKDPNELHRMVRLKDRNDTHAGFQQVVRQALHDATPAGDDIELSVSVMNTEEWVPRAEYEAQREENHRLRYQLTFIFQTFAVPKSVMKESEKLVNIFIDNEIRNTAPNEKGFVPVTLGKVAQGCGISVDTAGTAKDRLRHKVALYEQDTVNFFHAGQDGKTTMTSSIFLKPTPRQPFPRLYDTTDPIEWGGKREKKKPVICERCGSEHQELYKTQHCQDCGHMTSTRIDDLLSEEEEGPLEEVPMIVEALPYEQEMQEGQYCREYATEPQVAGLITKERDPQVAGTPHKNLNNPAIASSIDMRLNLVTEEEPDYVLDEDGIRIWAKGKGPTRAMLAEEERQRQRLQVEQARLQKRAVQA